MNLITKITIFTLIFLFFSCGHPDSCEHEHYHEKTDTTNATLYFLPSGKLVKTERAGQPHSKYIQAYYDNGVSFRRRNMQGDNPKFEYVLPAFTITVVDGFFADDIWIPNSLGEAVLFDFEKSFAVKSKRIRVKM